MRRMDFLMNMDAIVREGLFLLSARQVPESNIWLDIVSGFGAEQAEHFKSVFQKWSDIIDRHCLA